MTTRLHPIAFLLLAAACSASAQVPSSTVLSTDPAAASAATENWVRVGRLTLVQGQVEVRSDASAAPVAGVLNWPLTAPNLLITGVGSRTELRVGSTALRLDGGSTLEVVALQDDRLHFFLHEGSASIRVSNPEVVPEFVFETAQATVQLEQPGLLRVDAEQRPATTTVSVLEGQALVDGGGAGLTVRAGRSAEVEADDVRTLQARSSVFDDWAIARERDEAAGLGSSLAGTEMTGVEDLARYGSWSHDAEYGQLWIPQVAAGWSPYSDGRWSWIAPWGWTWIDNAPWGYAPFHYGSWVQVHQRWAWSPGRIERRPRWSPAPRAPGVVRPPRPHAQPLTPRPHVTPPRLQPKRPGTPQVQPPRVRPQPVRPGQERPGQDRPQPVRPGQVRPGQARPDHIRPESPRSEPIRTQPPRGEQERPWPGRIETARPDWQRPDGERVRREGPGHERPGHDRPGRERPADAVRPPPASPAQPRPEQANPAPRPPQAAPAARPPQSAPPAPRPSSRERSEPQRGHTDVNGVGRVER